MGTDGERITAEAWMPAVVEGALIFTTSDRNPTYDTDRAVSSKR
jgi:hypothetical protein